MIFRLKAEATAFAKLRGFRLQAEEQEQYNRMQIQRRMVGPVVVLDVSGRMVLSDPGSDAQFKECINGLIASGTPYVIVNVGAVTDIDTSGLSALVGAHISMASTPTRMKVINLTSRIRHLLHVTRLDAVFDLAESEEQALAAFTGLA